MQIRFIPAGAGNTVVFSTCSAGITVYPRWRGEHKRVGSICSTKPGLSPLARGTHALKVLEGDAGRFIPAGAGNTSPTGINAIAASVYPRWRGEHRLRHRHNRQNDGLSPLARGTQFTCSTCPTFPRFIPAGAGNTNKINAPFPFPSVYPRWRGEHHRHIRTKRRHDGLSPLARGTRFSSYTSTPGVRFIPAGAGNTASRRLHPTRHAVYPRWRGEHSKTTQLNFKPFLAYKKSTNFSVFLKIANSLIYNRQKRH